MSRLPSLNLSPRDKRALLLLVIVIGVIILVLGWIKPTFDEIHRLDRALVRERQKLQEVHRLYSALEALNTKEDLAQAQLKRRTLKNFSIASVIEGMAREAQMQDQVQYLKPDQSKFSEQYAEASVSLKAVQISPEQLVDFLYRIEASDHLLRIRSLQVRTQAKEPGTLDVTLTVFTLLPSMPTS